MAGITKLNPTSTTLNFESVGKNIDFFTVDYINAINGSAGPSGPPPSLSRSRRHSLARAAPAPALAPAARPIYTPFSAA